MGEGKRESDRTDYYLLSNLVHTGVKIREGKHEIKARSGQAETRPFGLVEHWIKWSSDEKENIINSIAPHQLVEWMAIEKKRYKKLYEVTGKNVLQPSKKDYVDDGCGVEFTYIFIPSEKKRLYTLGLEAFATRYTPQHNLYLALDQLELDLAHLKDLDSYGYPEMIKRLVN